MTTTPAPAGGPPLDDPGRFMSVAVDWRRVLTGLVVGVPTSLAIAYASQRVLEATVADIRRSIDAQNVELRKRIDDTARDTRDGDARVTAQLQREIDAVRADVRELRTQGKR